jgi:hypothetical protein
VASMLPCKKNTAGYIFYLSLISQADTKLAQANPTLAAGDVKIAKDDGVPVDLATLPVVDADFTKRVKVVLSQAETNADNLTIIFSDALGAEWCDQTVNIQTVATRFDDIVKAVWDEVLTIATHNIANSAGRRLRNIASTIIYDGQVGGGGATSNTVELEVGASTQDNIYCGDLIVVMSGLGMGQSRVIVENIGSTLIATIDKRWQIVPQAGDAIIILAFAQEIVSAFGTVVSATANTLQLSGISGTHNNVYRYSNIVVTSKTGETTEARLIVSSDGVAQTVTVAPDWTVIPQPGDVYKIMPIGRAVTESMSDGAITGDVLDDSAIVKIAEASNDWSSFERNQIRSALGINGLKNDAIGGQLQTILRQPTYLPAVSAPRGARPQRITYYVDQRSSATIKASFSLRGVALVPDNLRWTLTDDKGTTINSRKDIEITPAASVAVVLTGDDLAILEPVDSCVRILTIEGSYTSVDGAGLTLASEFRFGLNRLVGSG